MIRKLSLFSILFCGFLFGCCQAKGEQVFAARNHFCAEFYFSTFSTPTSLLKEFHREDFFIRLRLLLLFDDAIQALQFLLAIPFKRFFLRSRCKWLCNEDDVDVSVCIVVKTRQVQALFTQIISLSRAKSFNDLKIYF